jgi:excisionase family DNA binding protein
MALTLEAGADRLRLAATETERTQAGQARAGSGRLLVDGSAGPQELPPELSKLLWVALEAIAAGKALAIHSLPRELTTTVAADQLGVSRPTLMRMIRHQEIPARLEGSHHRLLTADVLKMKRERLERQRRAFDELRDLEDQLGQFGVR